MVTKGQTGDTETETDGWKTVRRTRSAGRPSTHRRPVDPHQEGRCFWCLARGHVAHSWREPVTCRLCWQGGHYQASCPLQMPPPTILAITELFACLVGELRDADPQWTHIIIGIQTLCPDLTSPDYHRLTIGDIFIRSLSKEAWRQIHDQTQRLNGGGSIFWQRPQPTDKAFLSQKTTRRLEARRVPFGLRTRRHLEKLTRPIGTLRKIVFNGLHVGDLNCLCLDVEMETDMDVPQKIPIAGEGRQSVRSTSSSYYPPSPLPICPPFASSSTSTQRLAPPRWIQEQKTPLADGTPQRLSPPRSIPKQATPIPSTDTPQGDVMGSPTA